jgi:hypothetical protein
MNAIQSTQIANEVETLSVVTTTSEPTVMSMDEMDFVGGGAGVDTIG